MNSINQKEPNPSFSPTTHATPFLLFFETPNSSDLSSPFKGSLHCGPLPEFTFRTFDNDDNVIVDTGVDVDVDVDPLKCFSSSNIGDIGLDDDIFSIYIDVKKLEEKEGENVVVGHHQDHDILQKGGGFVVGSGGGRRKKKERSKNVIKTTQPRKQRQRRSGQKGCCLTNETKFVEPRKAMAAEELAELWAVDPKRAKRIVANRHSAARSKERKAQCIINLEEKVKKLNWEVTSLTTRLTSNQRETTELAGEKSELKCQLQTMECQTEQIDAQIEALKLEIEWLKSATGEMDSTQMCQPASLPFTQSLSTHQQQLPLLHNSQPSSMIPPHLHVASSQPVV